MACDLVRPKIRVFLDDLLDEKDHQEIHSHLEACERCRSYASSVGTLSYRIYELGQAPLPPDMVSAILYEAKKPAAAPSADSPIPAPEQGFFLSKKDLFWVFIAVLLALIAVSFAVTAASQKREERTAGIPAPAAPSAPRTPEAAPEADGEQVSVRTE